MAAQYGYGNVFGYGDSVSCYGHGQHGIWNRDGMAAEPCGILVGVFPVGTVRKTMGLRTAGIGQKKHP